MVAQVSSLWSQTEWTSLPQASGKTIAIQRIQAKQSRYLSVLPMVYHWGTTLFLHSNDVGRRQPTSILTYAHV